MSKCLRNSLPKLSHSVHILINKLIFNKHSFLMNKFAFLCARSNCCFVQGEAEIKSLERQPLSSTISFLDQNPSCGPTSLSLLIFQRKCVSIPLEMDFLVPMISHLPLHLFLKGKQYFLMKFYIYIYMRDTDLYVNKQRNTDHILFWFWPVG